MELTPRQVDVITLIRNWKHQYGHSPSYRELASALKIARPTAIEHVRRLIVKGHLTAQPGLARTLEVVADVQPIPPKPPKRKKADSAVTVTADVPAPHPVA